MRPSAATRRCALSRVAAFPQRDPVGQGAVADDRDVAHSSAANFARLRLGRRPARQRRQVDPEAAGDLTLLVAHLQNLGAVGLQPQCRLGDGAAVLESRGERAERCGGRYGPRRLPERIASTAAGTRYCFRGQAQTLAGARLASRLPSATPENIPPPRHPGRLAAEAGSGRMTREWREPSSHGNDTVRGYDAPDANGPS